MENQKKEMLENEFKSYSTVVVADRGPPSTSAN